MTDKHDKLVEAAKAAGFCYVGGTLFAHDIDLTPKLAAFAAAHVASLCADVEPVAHRARNSVNEAWTYSSYPLDWRECQPLVPASTVAAITAQRDQALARVAELEAALRTADHTFAENGILASHAARQEIQAALTKGQP